MFEIGDLKYLLFPATISFLLTPIVRYLSIRFGALDVPKDDRRMHSIPIPSMGGIGIFLAFVLSLVLFIGPLDRAYSAMIFGSGVIVISGILDDNHNLTPGVKIVFQLIAAGIAMFGGIRVSTISSIVEAGTTIDLGLLSYPLTLIWIIGMTNAINLIDGLDGLAVGVSAIGAVSMSVLSFVHGNYASGLICLVLAGSCLGFLPYNFQPASIFMGDTGALFLGYIFSLITIEGVMKTAATIGVISPVIVLAIPISDTFFAIIRRTIIRGESFASADKDHLHHKILEMGFSVKETVLILYAIAAILGILAVVIGLVGGLLGSLIALGVIIFLVLGARRIGMLEEGRSGQ